MLEIKSEKYSRKHGVAVLGNGRFKGKLITGTLGSGTKTPETKKKKNIYKERNLCLWGVFFIIL